MRSSAVFLLAFTACTNPDGGSMDASADVASVGDANGSDVGSDVGTGDAAIADSAVDAPAPTAHFGFTVAAVGNCDGNEALAQCPVFIAAGVADLTGVPLDDATITVNDQPVPLTLMGLYQSMQTGFAASYHTVVTRGGETLETTIQSPSDFTLAITPDPPMVNTASTLTWNTTGEPDIATALAIRSGNSLYTYNASPPPADTGSFAVPAEAFPVSGRFNIEFQRSHFPTHETNTSLHSGPRHVTLSRTLAVTVP